MAPVQRPAFDGKALVPGYLQEDLMVDGINAELRSRRTTAQALPESTVLTISSCTATMAVSIE